MVHIQVLFSFLAVQLINAPASTPSGSTKPLVYGPVGPIACLIFVYIVLAVSAVTYRFVEISVRNYLNNRLNSKPLASQTIPIRST